MSALPQRTTPSKLYVSNLSQAATIASVRELFGRCGDVLDVEFAAERGASRRPSAAYVTMASSVAADAAVQRLQGRLHCDRTLMVSRMGGDSERPPSDATAAAEQKAASDAVVAITQQYRDRHAMTYELSCSGGLLTLRFLFPPSDAQDWQLEARFVPGVPLPVTASAPTRERAFLAMTEAWQASANELRPQPDWTRVAAAMRGVRAL